MNSQSSNQQSLPTSHDFVFRLLEQVSKRNIRFYLFVATLIVAMLLTPVPLLLTTITDPSLTIFFLLGYILFSWEFPLGLETLLHWYVRGYPYQGYPVPVLILGWFIYLGIIISAVRTKREIVYVPLYITFVFLLIMNMVGCQNVIH